MRPRNEQPVVTLILRALQAKPLTIYGLEPVIGITRRNLREYMKLLKEEKRIYVFRYETHGHGPKVPVYALGDHADAVYPRARTTAEQARIYKTRHRARKAMQRSQQNEWSELCKMAA